MLLASAVSEKEPVVEIFEPTTGTKPLLGCSGLSVRFAVVRPGYNSLVESYQRL